MSLDSRDIEDLPFVDDDKDGRRNFWMVEAKDLTSKQRSYLGTAFGKSALEYISATGFLPLLGWIIKDMKGTFGPMEISFLHEISIYASYGMKTASGAVHENNDGGQNG